MARLILIRHGETDYNSQKRYCGFSDPSLNEKGRWQAERLAKILWNVKIDAVYSSDLRRAYETAEIIFRDNSIVKLADFREINFGVWEGLTYSEIIEKHPEIYKRWIDNPMEVNIPGGETLKDFCGRIRKKLIFVRSCHKEGETIALITHGGPIRIILCDALGYNIKEFWQVAQDIGALNIIDYPNNAKPKVIKINHTTQPIT